MANSSSAPADGHALGGAESVPQHLRNELEMVMQLAGAPTIKSITREAVAPHFVA